MIKIIISLLHILKLMLFTQEKFGLIWTFSLLLLSTCSNYFFVKDIFYLYYTLKLSGPRKYLLRREKTMDMISRIFNIVVIVMYLYNFSPDLILLFFTFLVIFLHRLFYHPSLSELENLNFDNDLSLGYGAALCYYENYLKYILQDPHVDLETRIRMFKSKQRIENMPDKHFILIPYSCKVETYIDKSNFFSRCKELIPVEIDIAGIPKRTFNITVYHIKCDDDPKISVRLALEYAQPLKVLFSLKEKGLLSIDDMHKQREIFAKSLKKMLLGNRNLEQVHVIEYDDELPSQEGLDILFQVLMREKAVHEY